MEALETPATLEATPKTKREAIVAAAAGVFLENGYGAASMDEIARRAGVSKATVYAHFKGKDALFGAIVEERCHRMMAHEEATTEQDSPEAMLARIGRGLIDIVCVPSSIALYRVVLAEAARFPELGRVFFEQGLGPAQQRLAAYLGQLAEDGVIRLADPELGARQFLGMAINDLDIRLLLAMGPAPDDAERQRMAKTAVTIFLDGCRVTR
jgi:TetR/AcrR family transcriptional repressor of mexJK operon